MTSSSTPNGWRLVPADPTEEMYVAGYDATRREDGYPQFADAGFCLGHAGNIYRAMLNAAPPAPAPPAVPAVTDEMVAELARPIGMQDVRLCVGEGTLSQGDIIAGVNLVLLQRARRARSALARYRAAIANTGAPVREGDLEWLDAATRNEHPHIPYLREDGRWAYPVLISGAGGFGGGVGEKTFDTLLDAIKSARSEPPQ